MNGCVWYVCGSDVSWCAMFIHVCQCNHRRKAHCMSVHAHTSHACTPIDLNCVRKITTVARSKGLYCRKRHRHPKWWQPPLLARCFEECNARQVSTTCVGGRAPNSRSRFNGVLLDQLLYIYTLCWRETMRGPARRHQASQPSKPSRESVCGFERRETYQQ